MDQAGRYYAMPSQVRDKTIVELKRKGWTNARIGKQVGMSESGVRRAVDRIRAGGYGDGISRA